MACVLQGDELGAAGGCAGGDVWSVIGKGEWMGVSQAYDGSASILQLLCVLYRPVVAQVSDKISTQINPFHFHGHKPWLVGVRAREHTGAPLNTTNPMRCDTSLVSAFTWLVIRFKVDHAGYWAREPYSSLVTAPLRESPLSCLTRRCRPPASFATSSTRSPFSRPVSSLPSA